MRYWALSTRPPTRTRMRPKLIWSPLAAGPPANAASTAVTSSAESPPPASIEDSAEDQNASSGKLSGNETGWAGCGRSPMMQYGSPGSVQSSRRTLLVSLYQSGKPLVSSIGPTCLRPTVPPLCAGGGAAARATSPPEASRVTAAALTASGLVNRRPRVRAFMRSS